MENNGKQQQNDFACAHCFPLLSHYFLLFPNHNLIFEIFRPPCFCVLGKVKNGKQLIFCAIFGVVFPFSLRSVLLFPKHTTLGRTASLKQGVVFLMLTRPAVVVVNVDVVLMETSRRPPPRKPAERFPPPTLQ